MARTKSGTKKKINRSTHRHLEEVDIKVYPNDLYWNSYIIVGITIFGVALIVFFSVGIVDGEIPPLLGMVVAVMMTLLIIGWTHINTMKLVDKIDVFNKLKEERIQELQEQATEVVGKVDVYVKNLAATEEKYEKLLREYLELKTKQNHERVQQG